MSRLQEAGSNYSAALLAGADVSAVLLHDLRQFLQSDSNELPTSLRQLAKLAQSQEVARAAASLTSAALRGAQSSQASPSGPTSEAGAQPMPDLLERILAALTSERGHSLVGLAVSVACRSGVEALLEGWARAPESPGGVGGVHLHVESLAGHFGHSLAEQRAASAGWLQTLLDWAGSPGGERVVLNAISTFVRQGTQVYMQSFGDANMWDDILAAAGNPRHRHATEQLTRVFVNEAICSWFAKPLEGRAVPPSMQHTPPRPVRLRHQHQQTSAHCEAQPSADHFSHSDASDCSLASSSQPSSEAASPVEGVDLDSAFDEEIAARKPAGLGSSRLRGRAAAVPSIRDSALQPAETASASSWLGAVLEVVKRPEARSLILAMTPVVVAEGVRSGIFCGRDLLFGKQNLTGSHLQGLRLPAWMLGFVTLLIICWLAMRLPNISVAPMSQV